MCPIDLAATDPGATVGLSKISGIEMNSIKSNFTRRDFLKTTGAAIAAAGTFETVWAQTDKQITIAFVGAGHIHTPGFMDLVKTRKDVRVKSVWDHDSARAQQRAKDLNSAVVEALMTLEVCEKSRRSFAA